MPAGQPWRFWCVCTAKIYLLSNQGNCVAVRTRCHSTVIKTHPQGVWFYYWRMVRDWFRFATFPLAYSLREPAYFRLPFACGSNPRFVCSNPIMCDKNKMVARTIWFLWRMVRDSNPRWSRPHNGFQDRRIRPLCQPSETFFFFFRRSFKPTVLFAVRNWRCCSPLVSVRLHCVCLTYSYARPPPRPVCQPSKTVSPQFIFWHDKCQMFFILIFNFYFHICQPLCIKFHCDTFC